MTWVASGLTAVEIVMMGATVMTTRLRLRTPALGGWCWRVGCGSGSGWRYGPLATGAAEAVGAGAVGAAGSAEAVAPSAALNPAHDDGRLGMLSGGYALIPPAPWTGPR